MLNVKSVLCYSLFLVVISFSFSCTLKYYNKSSTLLIHLLQHSNFQVCKAFNTFELWAHLTTKIPRYIELWSHLVTFDTLGPGSHFTGRLYFSLYSMIKEVKRVYYLKIAICINHIRYWATISFIGLCYFVFELILFLGYLSKISNNII